MSIEPPPRALLEPVLASLGLPWPQRIRLPRRAWVHANYWLELGPDAPVPQLLLRRPLWELGYDSLGNEATALAIAAAFGGLPVVRRYQVLPPGSLPWPAALSEVVPGQDGAQWKARTPSAEGPVARVVGRVLAWLADRPLPHFGTRPQLGRFLPTQPTWALEWMAHVHMRLDQARSRGTDLQPLTDELVSFVREREGSLEPVQRFCLVHRDLSPANLIFAPREGRPVLTGVVDWEGAMSGDPLCEWGHVLEAPAHVLPWVLSGYGVERVRRDLLAPEALPRVELYLASRALARLGFAALPLFDPLPELRQQALELARQHGEAVLEPGAVRRMLEQALGQAATLEV